jgi:hypothetical protein
MSGKRRKKTPEETPPADVGELVPQPRGGALLRGNPGNKGGGRPPDEFRRRMAELVNQEGVEEYLEECLRGTHGAKPFVAALQHCTAYGYGKPTQKVEWHDKTPGTRSPRELAAEYMKRLEQVRSVEDMERLFAEAAVAQANAKPN